MYFFLLVPGCHQSKECATAQCHQRCAHVTNSCQSWFWGGENSFVVLKAVQNLIELMPVKDVLPLSFQMPLTGPGMLDAEQLSWDLLKMNLQGPALQ